ncbi:MAG TPA: tRNA threonylcarbamoyladenosine biosynthesis protein RimN [Oceanospirillales bacterium]|nr:tRNA threonylcarbamoyladenosine biosynthesis protein RimN [Oceanospirillales bacterium]|tara:strand:+ start:1682 stop:2242 length:561 start_codon:yes stop_codon:yes gene_type:complete
MSHPRINEWHVQQAAACIGRGGVIAYPTEAVWGLGCNPADEEAVRQILRLKQRPEEKGLILIGSDLSQFDGWIKPLAADDLARVQATWPGPVTWVLPCYDEVPVCVRGRHTSVAVRITAHPLVRALCEQTGPLISTSANPAGREPARSSLRVRQYFGTALDHILPGALGGRDQPSEIRTLNNQRLR